MTTASMKVCHLHRHRVCISILVSLCVIIVGFMIFFKDNALIIQELAPTTLKTQVQEEDNEIIAGFKRKNGGYVSTAGLEFIDNQPVTLLLDMSYVDVENIFYGYLETKSILCEEDHRLGNQHEGGWNVCMSPPFQLKRPCLMYSFGIGTDWRFEDDIYDYYGCEVRAFDPSIHLREHNRTKLIWFKPLGLGAESYLADNGWNMQTFKQHLRDAGHSKTVIDYVKFDVEYMEWDILQALLTDDSLHNVKQLAFEIHMKHPTEHMSDKEKFIRKEDFLEKFKILKELEEHGFKKFNYRLNPFCAYISDVTRIPRSRCYELHYLNMNFIKIYHLKNNGTNIHGKQ